MSEPQGNNKPTSKLRSRGRGGELEYDYVVAEGDGVLRGVLRNTDRNGDVAQKYLEGDPERLQSM